MWQVSWEERRHRCRARLVYSEEPVAWEGDLRTEQLDDIERVTGEHDGIVIGPTHTVPRFAQRRLR